MVMAWMLGRAGHNHVSKHALREWTWGLGLDIEPARLVTARLIMARLVNKLARLAIKLELTRLAREPNHKNTVQRKHKSK
jgi:hypothetical protein